MIHYLLAWAVHLFTASAAFIGLLTLSKIHHHEYHTALVLMGLCIIFDAVDGTFARLVSVKAVLPNIDGALLDNIVDYLNFVITPAFFLYVNTNMLPDGARLLVIAAIVLSSAYQFCQAEAKTPDHFFKGFPCYWNIAIFYFFIFESCPYLNAWLLTLLSVLVFVPILYLYPSRIDCLITSRPLQMLMHGFSTSYAVASAVILWQYPILNPICVAISVAYVLTYLSLSFYRTFFHQAPRPNHPFVA